MKWYFIIFYGIKNLEGSFDYIYGDGDLIFKFLFGGDGVDAEYRLKV